METNQKEHIEPVISDFKNEAMKKAKINLENRIFNWTPLIALVFLIFIYTLVILTIIDGTNAIIANFVIFLFLFLVIGLILYLSLKGHIIKKNKR